MLKLWDFNIKLDNSSKIFVNFEIKPQFFSNNL